MRFRRPHAQIALGTHPELESYWFGSWRVPDRPLERYR